MQAAHNREWLLFLVTIVILRLVLASYIPLMEFSEARYAEIARKMAAEGDWITLWFLPGEPFWGKPPMAFWSVAASFLVFGINEFAARLPAMLLTLATLVLLFQWLRRLNLSQYSWPVVVVYLSSALVLHISAVVLTDPLLILNTTLVMVCFYQAVEKDERWAGYLMWVGLAGGLMAKGPVALVLCGLACGSWVIWTGCWGAFFSRARLITGPVLMLALAAPWYLLAEQKTPGFLEYFIVGEHFYRYLESEWAGDPYGAVKDMPFAIIWPMLVASGLPWSLILLWQLATESGRQRIADRWDLFDARFMKYLLCWLLLPLMFFTPARNVIITYTLPALPALALLVSLLCWDELSIKLRRLLVWGSAIALMLGSLLAFELSIKEHRYNQRPILTVYQEMNQKDPGPLIYTGKPRFAALFYAYGDMEFTRNPQEFWSSKETFYMGVRDRWVKSISRTPLAPRCDLLIHQNDISLFYCPAVDTTN